MLQFDRRFSDFNDSYQIKIVIRYVQVVLSQCRQRGKTLMMFVTWAQNDALAYA